MELKKFERPEATVVELNVNDIVTSDDSIVKGLKLPISWWGN